MCSAFKSCIMCMICKYFLPHNGLPFHMLSIELEKKYVLFCSILLICTQGIKLLGGKTCILKGISENLYPNSGFSTIKNMNLYDC